MLKHYLKIALRNARKHKTYSFINVFGLALGIACCILVFLFVRDELRYDERHANGAQIYRVNLSSKTPDGGAVIKAGQPIPLAPTLKATFPEISLATRLETGTVVAQSGENTIKEPALFADADLLRMFTFPLLRGDAATALSQKNAVVLSETNAQKYFGNENPLGKPLTLNFGEEARDFIVTGVAQKIPNNSSLEFDLLLPYENSPNYEELITSWTSWGAVTFIQTTKETQAADLQNKFSAFVKDHYGAMMRTWQILGWLAKEEGALQLQLQPLPAIHLDPSVENGLLPSSNPVYSYILAGIGLIVLLIACINFMTLAIGRAASRTLEVGMRKTLGALRSQLMKQFWGEAMLFSLLALLLGLALAEAFLPVFNALANKTLAVDYFSDWKIYGVFLGLALFVGLIAGGYPAVFLSRCAPITTLKNQNTWRSKNRLSQTLIVAQFSLSALLIICALLMSDQLDLLKSRQLGFNEEQVVVIPTNARDQEGEQLLQLYREKLAEQNRILGVTGNSDGFIREPSWRSFGKADGSNYWQINVMRVDHDFVKTLGMEIVQGRDFSKEITSDAKHALLVNETLVKEFAWQAPVGYAFTDFDSGATVVGVLKDFNYASLHEKVKPLVLHLKADWAIRYIFVRIAPGDFAETLTLLRNTWRGIAPSRPFDYYFLDEDFDQQYHAEERWTQIVLYATAFALVIACVGLFGLSALTITKRTKEIGVRKVLGASVAGIVTLLSKEFVKLILLANLFAWPLAYFVMQEWLQDFAYRVEIGWWVFALAGGLALLVALLTVSYQAIKAALANPVEALRYE